MSQFPATTLSPSGRSQLERAEFYRQSGRIAKAVSVLSSLYEREPHPTVGVAYADALMVQGEFARSEAVLIRHLHANDDTTGSVLEPRLEATLLLNLSALHREMGRDEQASEEFARAIAIDPEIASPLELANEAILASQWETAERLCREHLEKAARNEQVEDLADGWGTLGVIARLRNDHSEAVKALWKAFELHHDAEDSFGAARDLVNLIESFLVLNRFEAAETAVGLGKHHATRCEATRLLEEINRLAAEIEPARAASRARWN